MMYMYVYNIYIIYIYIYCIYIYYIYIYYIYYIYILYIYYIYIYILYILNIYIYRLCMCIYIYKISSPNDPQRSPIHLVTSPPWPAPAEPPLAASQSAGHSRPPRAPRRCSTGRRRRAGPKWVGHTWRRIGDRFWMISMAKTGGQSIEIGTKHTRY